MLKRDWPDTDLNFISFGFHLGVGPVGGSRSRWRWFWRSLSVGPRVGLSVAFVYIVCPNFFNNKVVFCDYFMWVIVPLWIMLVRFF